MVYANYRESGRLSRCRSTESAASPKRQLGQPLLGEFLPKLDFQFSDPRRMAVISAQQPEVVATISVVTCWRPRLSVTENFSGFIRPHD